MKYATVCSGIGAPEAAWSDLWGHPVFTSEIEAFPSAVLAHHYPDVPNYGDMTKYKEWPDHELDVLVGGTPCQAFSVAGLRRSLEDERGNLTLTFLGIVRRYQPRFTIWENVPGVLNTSDNAFGQFLSGLTGFDTELHPTGGQWKSAGFIVGPERVAAWRVCDAQFYGVPQRRRRVFVIANPRNLGFASCQILFEPESMRGNTPKGPKAGEGTAGAFEISPGGAGEREVIPTLDSRCKDGPIRNQIGALVMSHGQGNAEICRDGDPSLTCNHEAPIVTCFAENSRSEVRLEGGDGQRAGALNTGGGKPGQGLPCIAIQDGRGMEKGQNGIGINEGGPAYTLDQTGAQAVAFQRSELRQRGTLTMHDKAPTLKAETKKGDTELTVMHNTIVRRLTPMECERLQGFPDEHTFIPWKKSMATDGHRYKALGNSMAVPVLKWIGERIQLWEDLHE